MIIGIGNDLCDIRRIEKTLEKFGERFARRCFTPVERHKAQSRANKAGTYAKRFAAKEACSKALGTGLSGLRWQEMEVINRPSGQPTMHLTGAAREQLDRLTPQGHTPVIHLTLSDEYPLAQAIVVIEARPSCG